MPAITSSVDAFPPLVVSNTERCPSTRTIFVCGGKHRVPGDIFDVDGSAANVLIGIRFRSAIVWGAALGMETSYS